MTPIHHTPPSSLPSEPAAADASAHGFTVLVVDDHELVRFGMQTYLRKPELGVSRVLVAASLGQALDTLARQSVDAVLLDLNLPDSKGLSTLSLLHRAHPVLPIAVVSGAEASVETEVTAMGAAGFFSKLGDLGAVGTWVRQQAERPRSHTPALPSTTPASPRQTVTHAATASNLLPRQLQVLDLLLAGCSNQQISAQTGLSLGTVKNYVSILLLHFQVSSRSQLIALLR